MKISIIIPTIGRETLQDVITGIEFCKGFKRIAPEVVVVFNGSPHDVPTLPKWVRLILLPEKVWAGEARNKGLDETSGDIVVFLGDDTIPSENWLEKIEVFHTNNPYKECTLLGMIGWVDRLKDDPWYKWLLNHAQFAFCSLKHKKPHWRHFYTANISLKRNLIEEERFSDQFEGWGFEDSEFGYRLERKGMRLSFDPSCKVYHDHVMTLEDIIKRTKSARHNAHKFEEIHPEVSLCPTSLKKIILQFMIWFSVVLVWIPQVKWWREWKKAWLD